MSRWTPVGCIVLICAAMSGCDDRSRRTRRARPPTAPAAPAVAKEDESARPPPPPLPPPREPAPAPLPPPPPERKPPRPAEDRSTCGPGGKGPRFDVHGVDPTDTLNVRAEPNAQSDVLGQLLPDTKGVVAVGGQQKVGPSTWRKVRCGDLIGWVNERFLEPQ